MVTVVFVSTSPCFFLEWDNASLKAQTAVACMNIKLFDEMSTSAFPWTWSLRSAEIYAYVNAHKYASIIFLALHVLRIYVGTIVLNTLQHWDYNWLFDALNRKDKMSELVTQTFFFINVYLRLNLQFIASVTAHPYYLCTWYKSSTYNSQYFNLKSICAWK